MCSTLLYFSDTISHKFAFLLEIFKELYQCLLVICLFFTYFLHIQDILIAMFLYINQINNIVIIVKYGFTSKNI